MSDELASAISLARMLLLLARSGQSGLLDVNGRGARARVTVVNGIPQSVSAIAGADEPLGDALLRAGQLNWEAHQVAVTTRPAQVLVGQWLVATGMAPRVAVREALRQQLHQRILRLLSLPVIECQFCIHDTEVIFTLTENEISVAALVLQGVRGHVCREHIERVRRATCGKILRLTESGSVFLHSLGLSAEERNVLRLLNAGCDWQALEKSTSNTLFALQTTTALFLLSAATAESNGWNAHALLARKHRQVRGFAAPRTLLDLPPEAPAAQARRALRRLSAQLHPDRLGLDALPAVRHASCEVLKALVRAEQQLR